MNKKAGIGIFGGTFDPVHRAHVQIAKDVLQALDLSQMRFVPSWQPVHREMPQASATDRLHMLNLVLAEDPNLIVDTREVDRKGPSYMVDTLESCRAEWPDSPLVLLLGSDAFQHFQSWHRWDHILELANIVVMKRPNIDENWPESLKSTLTRHLVKDPEALCAQNHGRILLFSVTQLPISSTDVRQRLNAGKDCSADLFPDVSKYIQKQHLYE